MPQDPLDKIGTEPETTSREALIALGVVVAVALLVIGLVLA